MKKPEFKENSIGPTQEEVKNLFNQLNPRDQLLRLMLLVDVPRDRRPSEDLTIAEREEEIVTWGKDSGNLEKLGQELRNLIRRQQV